MARGSAARVVTANALIEGDVVWLTAEGRWTRDLRQAQVFSDDESASAALAAAEARSGEVVGCYLANVRPTPNGPEPEHFREDFRRRGPSNYFHGKQAEA